MQRYMLRMLVILAVIGLLSAPFDLIRRLRRGPSPVEPVVAGPGGSAPVWHGHENGTQVPKRPAA